MNNNSKKIIESSIWKFNSKNLKIRKTKYLNKKFIKLNTNSSSQKIKLKHLRIDVSTFRWKNQISSLDSNIRNHHKLIQTQIFSYLQPIRPKFEKYIQGDMLDTLSFVYSRNDVAFSQRKANIKTSKNTLFRHILPNCILIYSN